MSVMQRCWKRSLARLYLRLTVPRLWGRMEMMTVQSASVQFIQFDSHQQIFLHFHSQKLWLISKEALLFVRHPSVEVLSSLIWYRSQCVSHLINVSGGRDSSVVLQLLERWKEFSLKALVNDTAETENRSCVWLQLPSVSVFRRCYTESSLV